MNNQCCFLENNDPKKRCANKAEYQIWFGFAPSPDDYTESCAEHLEALLDDSSMFEIIRL